MSDKISRAPEDHPNRCQSGGAMGQCNNFATRDREGNFITKFCAAHGGSDTPHKISELRRYRLGQWNVRVGELSGEIGIKSLREEIGIMRMMMEQRLKAVTCELDMVQASGPVGEMIMKIEKLVSSCQRLEERMGAQLDKTAVITYADQILEAMNASVESAGLSPSDRELILTNMADQLTQMFAETE